MATALTPRSLSEWVDRESQAPGAQAALREIHYEKMGRLTTMHRPTVLTWHPSTDDRKYSPFQPPPGSINIYWSEAGSPLIRELEVAHLRRDAKALERLAGQVTGVWKKRQPTSLPSAAKEAKAAPVLFDLRYGRKTLSENMWAPPEGCGTMTLPYNGGPVNTDDFSVVSYARNPDEAVNPAVLIVVAPPVLSELEQRALEEAGGDIGEVTMGGSPVACACLVTVVVFVAAVTVVTTCCQPFWDKLEEVELTDAMLRDLGARPSAAQLLAARAQIFEEFNVR